MPSLTEGFDRLAHWTARHAGRASTFALALAIIVAWGVSGPVFHWSDTWQLVINTGTTIVTFLMVFLIQNTQNRDTSALQRNFAFGQKHRIRGTPGLVFEDGRQQAGALNTEQIEKQLVATRQAVAGRVKAKARAKAKV